MAGKVMQFIINITKSFYDLSPFTEKWELYGDGACAILLPLFARGSRPYHGQITSRDMKK